MEIEDHTEIRNTRTYRIWKGVVRRGIGLSDAAHYYDRGIEVCDRWLDYRNFLKDMGHAPARYSLDRIDVNKGYFPENCRWATIHTQANNKTNTRRFTFKGEPTPLAEIAFFVGIPSGILISRLNKNGGCIDQAIASPHASNYQKKCSLHGINPVNIFKILNFAIKKYGNKIDWIELGFYQLREFLHSEDSDAKFPCELMFYKATRIKRSSDIDSFVLVFKNGHYSVEDVSDVPYNQLYKYRRISLLPQKASDTLIYEL